MACASGLGAYLRASAFSVYSPSLLCSCGR